MNNQDAINRNWQYFIVEQHPPAYDVLSQTLVIPAYVTDNGARCAIGCLFPDFDFRVAGSLIEGGITEEDTLELIQKERPEISQVSLNFLDELQQAHDNWAKAWHDGDDGASHDFYAEQLRYLATCYGLAIPE